MKFTWKDDPKLVAAIARIRPQCGKFVWRVGFKSDGQPVIAKGVSYAPGDPGETKEDVE